ncbi:unnamed protein product [Penicillium egyptiacum]|uniref:Uncharacterized protein n=1 Tax=Penicillium egyptiacum TaxID=1303716 RepID=A0A9W4KJS5_9EURO|nr:unnamed protein product [Penicillium egyptiacum]
MAAALSCSSIASSGLFSAATKAETLRLAGAKCWACSTAAPEICHVVPHPDPQIPVPTNTDYKQHEIDRNMILPTAVGGRYSRVFLKQFLHSGEVPGLEKLYSSPKEWHGAPLASIRRAFAALASPRFFIIIDPNIRHILEELRQLYFSDDRLSPEQVSLRAVYRPHAQTSRKHQLEDPSHDELGRFDKKAKGQTTGSTEAPASTNQCRAYTEWVLGPESTTNDVVKLYAPVFSST